MNPSRSISGGISFTGARRRCGAALAVAVVLGLSACNSAAGSSATSPSSTQTQSPASPTPTTAPSNGTSAVAPSGTPAVITSDLEAPWSVTFLGDGTPLVSQRDNGAILELTRDGQSRVIGTVDGVEHVGESGLLGLAVDEQDRLYAYSTGPDGNRIHRFRLTGQPGAFGLGPAEVIIDGLPSASYHDGGRIAFGPDGMLYATVGDAGQGDEAQDPESLAGKVLRLTPDGDAPADNPTPGSLVYSHGHRNPQGIAWAADGTMFATEFGQNDWDELNVITPGANYGWPTVEGIAGDDRFVDPVQQWSPAEASPSGIVIIDETIFIANLRGQVLRAVPVTDPTSSTSHYGGEYGRLRDVASGPDGELWMITNNTDGRGQPGPDDDQILAVPLFD